MIEVVDDFLKCLEEERFYDAHEVFEDVWFPRRFEKSDETLLLKGLINAAVSFELIKRGRPGPAEKAWRTYEKYRPCHERLSEYKEQFSRAIEGVEQTRRKYV